MATSVESANATAAKGVEFGLRSIPNSPLQRVPALNRLRKDFKSSTTSASLPQPSSPPSASAQNLAISSSTTSTSTPYQHTFTCYETLEEVEQPDDSGRREANIVLAQEEAKENEDELRYQQTVDDIIKRETDASTTSLEVENEAIFVFWGRLIQRFGGAGGQAKAGSAYPEAALLDIMEIISLYASHEITMQDAFTQLAAVFRRNKCLDLFEDLINLLLHQDIRKDFLIKKGVNLAFLTKKERKQDSEPEDEEEEDDYEQEEREETDVEEEEEDEDEEPPTPKKSKRNQPTRKRKGRAASAPKKKAQPSKRRKQQEEDAADEAGRLRRSPDKWTPEEDEKLMELVEKYGVGTKKWRQIADELGTTKNSAKCAQHWRRVLAPNIHKGSWSADEEKKLLEGVQQYGLTQWTLVAKDIPGRTDIQCRYHYMRQQNSRAFSWTIEEENILAELVDKHGADGTWIEISDELADSKIRRTPRTALECQEHWALMKEREPKKKKTKKTKKSK